MNGAVRVVLTEVSRTVSLTEGALVCVRILSSTHAGRALVAINGERVRARVPQPMHKGAVLFLRASIRAGTVFLHPQCTSTPPSAEDMSAHFLQRWGVSFSPEAAALIHAHTSLCVPLQPQLIERFALLLKKFPEQKRAHAAFLASILGDRNIPVDAAMLRRMLSTFLGESGAYTDSDTERDLFALVNHTYHSALHWLLVPFERRGAHTVWRGTLSLLLHLHKKTCTQLRVRACNTAGEWVFCVQNNVLTVQRHAARELSRTAQKKTVARLCALLRERGIDFLSVRYGAHADSANDAVPFKGIDVSV